MMLSTARSVLFAFGGLRGAVVIHNRLLASVLSTSVQFFDITPVGHGCLLCCAVAVLFGMANLIAGQWCIWCHSSGES